MEDSSPLGCGGPTRGLGAFLPVVHALNLELTFDRFVPWATVVLSDFAAVDHELADVHAVFQNLADIQGIEDWSFGEARGPKTKKRLSANGAVCPLCMPN